MDKGASAMKQQAETYTGAAEDNENDPADDQPEGTDYIPPPDEVCVDHNQVT